MAVSGSDSLARSQLDSGRSAWPGIHVPEELLREYLSLRGALPPHADEPYRRARSADLYLACACLHGVPGALEAFESHILSKARWALRKMDPSLEFQDEVIQQLRTKLFVGSPHGPAKLSLYSGRGALSEWVEAAAVRTALNVQEATPRGVSLGTLDSVDLPLARSNPELELLRKRHLRDFEDAFRAALSRLSDRDVVVLRLNVLEELNIEQIGAMYSVHRATVARWIARSRELLLAHTRERLEAKLGLGRAELESLFRLIASSLDLTLTSLLTRA